MPVYFIRADEVEAGRIRPDKALAHHLRNVLRLNLGESIRVVDETPIRYHTKVVSTHPDPLILEIAKQEPAPEELPSIRLGIGTLKRTKMEWLLQKASELGATQVSPLITERTVVRVQRGRSQHQQVRWQKIMTEAAQQSCQWQIPELSTPCSLSDFLSHEENPGFKFIFLERLSESKETRKSLRAEIEASPKQGALLIGPEGGWSASEIHAAKAAGFRPLSLGTSILRAETAALAALSIIQYEMANGSHRSTGI